MKIGKYPIKRTYKIAQLICDILSLGFLVMTVSLTFAFLGEYHELLATIGSEHIAGMSEQFIAVEWRQWSALIFPLLIVGVLVAYIVLIFKSHRFARFNVTKLTAQKCYETYAFFVSLAKLPVIIIIIDYMMIVHDKLRLAPLYGFSWFSPTSILYLIILVIVIRFGIHRMNVITKTDNSDRTDKIHVTSVVKAKSDDVRNDTE